MKDKLTEIKDLLLQRYFLILVIVLVIVFGIMPVTVKGVTYPSGCFTAVFHYNSSDGLNRLFPFDSCATERDLLSKVTSPTPGSYEGGCRFSDKTCWTKKDTLDGNYNPDDGWAAHQDHCSFGIYKYTCNGKVTSCRSDTVLPAAYPATITSSSGLHDCPAGFPGEVTATINPAGEVCGKTIEMDVINREYYLNCLVPGHPGSGYECSGTDKNGLPNNIYSFIDSLVWYTGDCSTPPSPNPVPTIQGKVINTSGVGVSGVRVWISDESSSVSYVGGKYKSVTTGSDGKFSGQVTMGTHGYWVRIPGEAALGPDGVNNLAIFTSTQATNTSFTGAGTRSYEAQPFDTVSHGCWNDCNFTVQLVSPPTSVPTIQGKVINTSGVGVSGVRVWISDESSSVSYVGGKYKSVITDTTGHFSGQVTTGSHGYWVRIPHGNPSLGADNDNNDATFTSITSSPQSYEAQPFDTVSHGCWNDCNFTVISTSPVYTTDYRCADQNFASDDTSASAPGWKAYHNSDDSNAPVIIPFTFTHNLTPGNNLTLFCQFKDTRGTTSRVFSKSIKYIGGDPSIKHITCEYDPVSVDTTTFTILGTNFGARREEGSGSGNVKVSEKSTNITYWAEDTSGSSSSASLDVNYKVIAKINEKLAADSDIPVVLTTADGKVATSSCRIGATAVDLTAKTSCGPLSGDLSENDVTVEIVEKAERAKPIFKQAIRIDKRGKPADFNPKLETGKTYILSIKSPGSLTKKIEFVAGEGTTALGQINMMMGDIFPVADPDNIINTYDKNRMLLDWSLTTDVTKAADLNRDHRVNSVDYSCLLINYNQTGN